MEFVGSMVIEVFVPVSVLEYYVGPLDIIVFGSIILVLELTQASD